MAAPAGWSAEPDAGPRARPSFGLLLRVSVPMMVAAMSETVIDVIDALFLARVGTVELGAVAIADAIYETALFLTLGIVDGVQILVARRAGQGRERDVGRVFDQGVYLLGAASLLLFGAVRLLGPYVTATVVESPAVRDAADAFLGVIVFGVLFESLNLAYCALYVGLAQTRVLVTATAVLAGVNVALDYCLVFGHLGAPRLGIRGAALASVLAEAACCAFLTVHTVRRLDLRRYRLLRFGGVRVPVSRALMRLSSPVMLHALVQSAGWFCFFAIVEQRGEEALAASNIVYSVYTVFLIAVTGIAETACSMVSNVIGQEREGLVGGLLRRAIALAYVLTVPLAVAALVAPAAVLRLFTPDPALVDASIGGLRVVCVGMLAIIPGHMVASAVAGTGDTPAALAVEVVGTTTLLIGAWAALAWLGLPIAFAWSAQVAAALLSLALGWVWLRGSAWKRLVL